jgi:curli biogenesis system outer membrane secretion channel CsgG
MRQAAKSLVSSGLPVLPILLLVAACAMTEPTARVTSGGGPGLAQAQSMPYDGPQARIAVTSFVDKTAKGYPEIGDGLADMLTTELFHTNRFIVLERQMLGEVLAEQDLAAAGRVKAGTEAPIGEIEGAELLITGAVTEFEPNSAGIGGGVIFGGLPIALGGGGSRSHLAIDMRVVDAKTSRIVAAVTVEGTATDIGGMAAFQIGGGLSELGIGLGGYKNTPMEKAVRIAIREAVNFISGQTPGQYYRQQ